MHIVCVSASVFSGDGGNWPGGKKVSQSVYNFSNVKDKGCLSESQSTNLITRVLKGRVKSKTHIQVQL